MVALWLLIDCWGAGVLALALLFYSAVDWLEFVFGSGLFTLLIGALSLEYCLDSAGCVELICFIWVKLRFDWVSAGLLDSTFATELELEAGSSYTVLFVVLTITDVVAFIWDWLA